MTTADSDAGYTDSPPAPDNSAGHRPTDEELEILRLWKDGAIWQDPRYAGKSLLKIIGSAMGSSDFRTRLLADPDSVLRDLSSAYGIPEGFTIEFYENTPQTLRVVLPPLISETAPASSALRDQLQSRTSGDATHFFNDDCDLGDWTDPIPGGGADRGDQTNRDSIDQIAITLEA